ncbi:LruC domain-containing protein [Bacteroides thetaiotaomicron]|nr:LruC domain-containing protein [Bacteroides thetaiotaomicron]MDC2159094.1 LruC domain-containing protein [Bacteroides thetaiotaomicron]
MRSLKYFSFGVIGMVLASCVEEKNLYNPDEGTPEDAQLGLSTDFLLKTQRSIFITAVDGDGKSQAGVKFGVFMSQPYTGEGVISIDPVFVGYTDASGKLKAEVVIGNNVSKIYVAPLTAGYGQVKEADVQDFVSLDFQGVSFPHMAVSRAFSIEIPSFSGPISGLYQLYIPYKNVEISRDGIPLQGGCSLVSKEQLSPALINQIDSWYPERQNVQKADLDKNSDLRVVDENGARVWVTYVGDGGFYVANQTVYNSLMYYNYKEGELNSPNDIDHLRMTMLLPNTNQLQCPSGLKVQLLYWNGKEYTEIFPKGTRIGFVVARAGYKKDGADVTTKNAYSFKNKTNPVVNGDVSGMYYSTPVLNKWGKSQAVTRQLDGYNCCVTGFDIRPFGDNQSDYDFNDVMLKVTATPEKAIEPGEDIPVEEEVVVTESIHGTLAFEDQWPNAGDYDLNDFVVNYTYGLGKNTENKITSIKLRFKPIAKGAAAYTKIGFGIELPLAENYIDAAKVMGATFESGNSKATFVIWEDASKLFPNINGFVNTEKGTSFVSAAEVEVTIPLTIPVDNVSMMRFNPFIFVNNRSHEIHLTDFAPTSKMDTNLLQTADDRSDASRNIYYRMEDMSCWALDFPRTSASDPAWRYPKEKSSVVKAYKNYSKWVINKTDLSWFDSTISENVDENELY